MTGRKAILLLKGKGKMRRIAITDLSRYHLNRYFAVEQLPRMLQLVLLVIAEERFAVIPLEFRFKAGWAHCRDPGKLFYAWELRLVVDAKVFFDPGQAEGVLRAKYIPVAAELVHDKKLLKQVFDQYGDVSDRKQLPERMLHDLCHKVLKKKPVFKGDRPAERMVVSAGSQNGLYRPCVEILNEVLQPRSPDPDDQRADDSVPGISDHFSFDQVGDGNR